MKPNRKKLPLWIRRAWAIPFIPIILAALVLLYLSVWCATGRRFDHVWNEMALGL